LHTASWVTEDEVGIIERDIVGLREVIILADKIEKPMRYLLDAVIDNFMEGVTYIFLIPPDSYRSSAQEFLAYYNSLASIAVGLTESNIDDSGPLCRILALRYHRKDYPYIFYKYRLRPDLRDEVIAFRGNEMYKGIARYYRRLEPEVAFSILEAALNATVLEREHGGLQELAVAADQFKSVASADIVELRSTSMLHASAEAQNR
jgi:hypothetical protein